MNKIKEEIEKLIAMTEKEIEYLSIEIELAEDRGLMATPKIAARRKCQELLPKLQKLLKKWGQ